MSQPDDTSYHVDLNNCDREPIHIPGAIQPHGCLLVYSSEEQYLTGYSKNAPQWIGRVPKFGEPPEASFSNEFVDELRDLLKFSGGIVHHIAYPPPTAASNAATFTSAAAHHHDGQILIELERPSQEGANARLLRSLPLRLNLANQRLQACRTPDELYQTIAREVRELSGYDRVMVYRFLEDGHGAVVGEAVDERFGRFLGLHYPATDIPQPARRLYLLNTVRSIADIEATPADIVRDASVDHRPLDLSYSCFRAVSPIHIEYLRNMGVRASMSISIIDNGKLWGLIACHHYEPRSLSFEDRAACEILGITVGTYLTARERDRHNEIVSERRARHALLMRRLAAADHFAESLAESSDSLRELVDADGVAVCWRGGPTSSGDTPDSSLVAELATTQLLGRDAIWTCQSLVNECGYEQSRLGPSRGVLAVPLATPDLYGLLFFRNEYIHEVHWAGNPNKPAEVQGNGVRLSPRRSFDEWSETVKDRAREWSAADLDIADDIRGGMIELLGRRAAQLAAMNAELRRLNDDLDSFAYAASHDLREPLRGLNHNLYMLAEELKGLPEQPPGIAKRREAIGVLCDRMDDLVQGLLRLSRAGRGELEREELELRAVVRDAIAMAWNDGAPEDVSITVEDDAGPLKADYACLRELLANLLSNAAKYNQRPVKSIVVRTRRDAGRRTRMGDPPIVVDVEDNGVGMTADQIPRAFEIFRRLLQSESYGDGTGAGLAIVKKIVHRHGGEIWVDSTPGIGSTFRFTLEASD
ncbi:Phytochrome-like protein cph1 [Planctomycetes bacterium Pan216]|uniref:histidine kinase n=1 Tax=Kolteria novifilia TaxID=2527975 RepID=A0A518B725_9BACT|nr:Phytochrome-like protein cph1 [Planctomycetes bacterium Pan216]